MITTSIAVANAANTAAQIITKAQNSRMAARPCAPLVTHCPQHTSCRASAQKADSHPAERALENAAFTGYEGSRRLVQAEPCVSYVGNRGDASVAELSHTAMLAS